MGWLITIIIVLLIALLLLLRSEYERSHPVVRKEEVVSEKLPKSFSGMKILYLSDFHLYDRKKGLQKMISDLIQSEPDLVLIGGDMLTSYAYTPADFSTVESLLSAIPEGVPIYYTLGNHEQRMYAYPERYEGWVEVFRQMIRKYKIHLIVNESVSLQRGNEEIRISGATVDFEYYSRFKKTPLPEDYFEKHIGKPDDRFHIVMEHSPSYIEECAAYGADLTLAGHFHGGTIWLPLLKCGLMSPQFQFFVKCAKGTFHFGEKTAIVSGGLGTHSINLRLFNKPEQILITLKRKEPEWVSR